MGTYSISRMMKPSLGRAASNHSNTNKNTYRKCRDQLITHSFVSNGRSGRTYNLKDEDRANKHRDDSSNDTGRAARQSNDYEPVTRSFIENNGA